MSPTQTLTPAGTTSEDIELASLPMQPVVSSTSTAAQTVNTTTSSSRAERALASSSNLTDFPDPLGLRARIFTPSDVADKGS